MKALPRILGLCILSILVFNNSMAQKASYTSNGGLTIGFGAGTAYQKSDLANSRGLGFDFILGSQLYKKENAFLSVDWKFRFLAGENKAYDINTDNTFSNISYSFTNYDLELGLTLNRLRERTGIILTGFAGAGVTYGRTFTDSLDAGNNLYDYSSIDPDRDRKLIYNDLRLLSDGDFETHLANKAALLPTVGFYIGYQLSRSISLGVEFKTNFYLTEQNSFVGINLDNKDISGSAFDRNNYVSMGLRWNLRGGSSNKSVEPLAIPVALPAPLAPSVNITDPSSDPYHTVSYSHSIRAMVNNVSGPGNISFFQNGFPNYKFTYNASTKLFSANVTLQEEENSFRIKARNQTSVAEDEVRIILDVPIDTVETTPAVGYTPPTGDYVPITGGYTPPANVPTTGGYRPPPGGNTPPPAPPPPVTPPPGNYTPPVSENTVVPTVITKESKPCDLPEIRLMDPAKGQVTTERQNYVFRAEVFNVANSSQLKLRVNRKTVTFRFSNNIVSSSIPLISGSNIISLHAKSECGEDNASARITYNPPVEPEPVPEPCTPPTVSIALNEVPSAEATYELTGTVSEVPSRAGISVTIDGSSNNGFQFVPSAGALSAKFKFEPGSHTLVVSVKNECGTDSKTKTVTVEEEEEEEAACGVRINPGNSSWQFCMQTPSGTFTRENLRSANFSYSGTATSLFFKPIGGGGDAIVNGSPYVLRSGQYYLFTGNLNVSVSNNHPGSMGHWSVCISANKIPVTGSGNNRPKSPCEVADPGGDGDHGVGNSSEKDKNMDKGKGNGKK